MTTIQAAVRALKLNKEKRYGNLTVFPLLHPTPHKPRYLTLDQALRADRITIREVSETGSVPRLLVENRADRPVLLLDGEELVGAKQNRILNLTILVPAGKTMEIPVSCVESGRWRYRGFPGGAGRGGGRDFKASGDAHFYGGRSSKAAAVSRSLRMMGSAESDQQQVWADIKGLMCELSVESPTSAMASLYASRRRGLKEYEDELRPSPDQVGAVFAVGDRIAGVEFFDSVETFGKLWPKIVGSYAIDVMSLGVDEERPADAKLPSPPSREAQGFLNQLAETEMEAYPALGLGEDLRVAGEGLAGGGLVHEEDVIHFAAFVG